MTTDPSNEIAYTVTLQDVLSAQRLSRPSPWKHLWLETVLFGSTCAIVGGLGGVRSLTTVISFPLALAVAYAALAFLLRQWWFVHRVGRIYRGNISFQGLHRGSWDKTGMQSESAQSRRKVQWSDIIKRCEDRETVLLYQSPSVVHFIPKRVLSPTQLASLRPYLDRIPIERSRPFRLFNR